MSHPIFSKLSLVLVTGASVLSISACTHPNAMPTGYTYHHDTYKSAPPPLPKEITVEQRNHMDAVQAEQFRDGTYDLLEALTTRAGMPPKPVYVLAPKPMSTFYANIDNDLRENMRHIGYALSDTPVEAYVFTYNAEYIEPSEDMTASDAANVLLTLSVYDGMGEAANLLSTETGSFYIKGAETLDIQPTSYDMMPKAK